MGMPARNACFILSSISPGIIAVNISATGESIIALMFSVTIMTQCVQPILVYQENY
jgi:hypothetical protein